MKQRVYISGRMSGIPVEEYTDNFNFAEMYLREQGYKVYNPADWGWFLKHFSYKVALVFDLLMMCRCDRIYMLKGWSDSNGARIEYQFACITGMIIMYEE